MKLLSCLLLKTSSFLLYLFHSQVWLFQSEKLCFRALIFVELKLKDHRNHNEHLIYGYPYCCRLASRRNGGFLQLKRSCWSIFMELKRCKFYFVFNIVLVNRQLLVDAYFYFMHHFACAKLSNSFSCQLSISFTIVQLFVLLLIVTTYCMRYEETWYIFLF